MKQNIREKHPTTVKELICQHFETYLTITADYIHLSNRSSRSRLNTVLKTVSKPNTNFNDFLKILAVCSDFFQNFTFC